MNCPHCGSALTAKVVKGDPEQLRGNAKVYECCGQTFTDKPQANTKDASNPHIAKP